MDLTLFVMIIRRREMFLVPCGYLIFCAWEKEIRDSVHKQEFIWLQKVGHCISCNYLYFEESNVQTYCASIILEEARERCGLLSCITTNRLFQIAREYVVREFLNLYIERTYTPDALLKNNHPTDHALSLKSRRITPRRHQPTPT